MNGWIYLEAGGSSASGFVGQGQNLVVLIAVGRRRRRRRIGQTLTRFASFANFQTEETQRVQNHQRNRGHNVQVFGVLRMRSPVNGRNWLFQFYSKNITMSYTSWPNQ